MAIVTQEVASFANGLVRVERDLNESNLRLNKARGINESPFDAWVGVFKDDVLVGEEIIPAGSPETPSIVERNLPASIKLTAVPQPNDDDDGPISMGPIQIRCRWPA